MANIVDAQKVEGLTDTNSLRVAATVQDTANSTLTLSVASPSFILLTGSVAGQIVKLGDATTYQVGHLYLIQNSSTASVAVQDNSGAVIRTLASNERCTLVLQAISTAAGTWVYEPTTTGTDPYWSLTGGLLTWTDSTGADLLVQQIGGLGSAYIRQQSANGTPASPTAITSGQRIGGYGYYGWNSTGGNANPSAEVTVNASENHTSTGYGGDMLFSVTQNGTTTSVERVRLANSGRLLIGTATDNGDDILQIPVGQTTNIPALECFDDFDWTTLGSGTNPHSVVSFTAGTGAGATVQTTPTASDYFGLITISTGTTTTGRGALEFFNSVNKIRLGACRIFFEGRVQIPTLSTGGQTFTFYYGLVDGNASGLPANGVYFSYTNGTDSGAWRCSSTAASSTSNLAPTGITVVAGAWYKLRAHINAARTNVDYYINDAYIGSLTTNIPASTAPLRFSYKIESSQGATARTALADYCYWKIFR